MASQPGAMGRFPMGLPHGYRRGVAASSAQEAQPGFTPMLEESSSGSYSMMSVSGMSLLANSGISQMHWRR